MIAAVVAAIAFLIALGGTWIARRIALRHDIMDEPNERSSHRFATPRGGGIAIVAAVGLTQLGLALRGQMESALLLVIGVGGLSIAIVGFLDDRRGLPVGMRLLAHVSVAVWALICLGGLPVLQFGHAAIDLGWAGYAIGVVCVVWVLNLFNFMDGVDALAASEAAFICLAGALLHAYGGHNDGVTLIAFATGAASLGFLAWNWPPARIFMGDVGSAYLGYVIAALAIAASWDEASALFAWLILGGAFFADATATLLRRALRHERVHEAHRSHAYQWLARRWDSHRRVTMTLMVVNLLWLLPCAILATHFDHYAAWIALGAILPLMLGALAVGAGRPDLGTG